MMLGALSPSAPLFRGERTPLKWCSRLDDPSSVLAMVAREAALAAGTTRSIVTRTENTALLSPSPGYGAHAWPFLS